MRPQLRARGDFRDELRQRFMASAEGDPIRALDDILELMWKTHAAATDGPPVPFNRWLLDGGPAALPDEIAELRTGYDVACERLPDDVHVVQVDDALIERVAVWFSRERYLSRVYDLDRERARNVLATVFLVKEADGAS